MKLEIDIKTNLQKYLPSIFSLLSGENIDWDKVSLAYQKELLKRSSKMSESDTGIISVEACLFDIITKVIQSSSPHTNLLKFFDDIFQNLAAKTSLAEKRMIRMNVFNLLINTNKNYLNFIGEFAILNILKNEGYELIQTEQPLDDKNKKSTKVDFSVKRDNKILLIEVVNIHLPSFEKISIPIVEQILEQKIIGKINKKQKMSNKVFYLAPVIWGEYNALELVNEYYITSKPNYKNTLYPAAFVSYNSKDGELSMNKFGAINKILLSE